MDLNLTDSSLKKKYIYADRQILAQHDIDDDATPDPIDAKYFYLHDRLGSVRLVIADNGSVVKYYTYEPFGEAIDDDGTFDNAFRFTGQYFDSEIEEYYLRARQYNPGISRFTSRDPVQGNFKQPLTLHKYLYCENDPVNLFDPNGASSRSAGFGVPQLTFENYLEMWNTKEDPEPEHFDELTFWTTAFVVGENVGQRLWSGSGTIFAPVSGGAAFLFAGKQMYNIMYLRMLQNGMINAILREDFGIEADLYDVQDFLYEL